MKVESEIFSFHEDSSVVFENYRKFQTVTSKCRWNYPSVNLGLILCWILLHLNALKNILHHAVKVNYIKN